MRWRLSIGCLRLQAERGTEQSAEHDMHGLARGAQRIERARGEPRRPIEQHDASGTGEALRVDRLRLIRWHDQVVLANAIHDPVVCIVHRRLHDARLR